MFFTIETSAVFGLCHASRKNVTLSGITYSTYNLGSITKFLQLVFKLEFMFSYMILSWKETKLDHICYDNIWNMTLTDFVRQEV